MATDTKALRSRIKSVDSTLHLTKAMGLVASSKIRKASAAMQNARQYVAALEETIRVLASSADCSENPFFEKKKEERPLSQQRIALIVVAGDRGLAGGYNANIFRAFRDLQAQGIQPCQVYPIGKRSNDRFGRSAGYTAEGFRAEDAEELAKHLCNDYLNGRIDRVAILSSTYISLLSQEPILSYVLPLQRPEKHKPVTLLFEPSAGSILSYAVPQYLAGRIVAAVKESFACEVSARRMAMDSAGKNAKQMIDTLQLQYNRARQGAITQEITEIVAGSGR